MITAAPAAHQAGQFNWSAGVLIIILVILAIAGLVLMRRRSR